MNRVAICITSGLLIIIAGCLPSLNPLYTGQDLIFDETLLGLWDHADSEGVWEFTRAQNEMDVTDELFEELALTETSEKTYLLKFTDQDGKLAEFWGHLIQIKDRKFLDVAPVELTTDDPEVYTDMFMPTHMFFLVSQEDNTLRLSVLNPDWLDKLLKSDPDALELVALETGSVLSSSPHELQQFLSEHLDDPGAFAEWTVMHRKS